MPQTIITGVDDIKSTLESINRSIEDSNRIMLALVEIIATQADRETGYSNCVKIFGAVKAQINNRQVIPKQRRKFDESR